MVPCVGSALQKEERQSIWRVDIIFYTFVYVICCIILQKYACDTISYCEYELTGRNYNTFIICLLQ